MSIDLTELLKEADDHVREELAAKPDVIEVSDLDLDDDPAPITARRWYKVVDVVAVVADLKSSTQLGVRKHAASTASIYAAALEPLLRIARSHGAGYAQLQGDCVVALFWAEDAVERAMCAAITMRTFSEDSLVLRMEKKWRDEGQLPATGFKIGVATSPLLVKRIGIANTSFQDLVWPGKAVNYAAKAAQSADRHETVVTGSIWDAIAKNDYLTFSCDCGTPSDSIWQDHGIDALDHDNAEQSGRLLTADWCDTCGSSFHAAILAGETRRDTVDPVRAELNRNLFRSALAKKHARERESVRHQLSRRGVLR